MRPAYAWFGGTSEKNPRDKYNADRWETDEWMFGSGGKVLGGILAVIVLSFIVARVR